MKESRCCLPSVTYAKTRDASRILNGAINVTDVIYQIDWTMRLMFYLYRYE